MTSAKAEDTATPPLTLNELERDALAELANIGVSRAASSLRKMVGQQVLLSVPSVEVMSQKTAAALVAEREGNRLIAVQQEFLGFVLRPRHADISRRQKASSWSAQS